MALEYTQISEKRKRKGSEAEEAQGTESESH